jgi:hypothetical protein
MNCDQTFFAILYRARDGRLIFAERTAADAASLSETVKDINEGQVDDVVAVLASNPAEGWSKDASEDVARECAKALCDNGRGHDVRTDLRDFIESHCGLGTVLPVVAFEPADAA